MCLIALAAVSASAGCGRSGPAVYYVEGMVLLDGQPLDGAAVGFSPDQGGMPATGKTDQRGVYRLTTVQGGGRDQGAAPGGYTVTVRKWQNRHADLGPPPDGSDSKAFAEWQTKEAAIKNLPPDYVVPMAYGDKATSGLKATVTPGRNVGPEFRFELTGDFEGG